MWIIDCDSAWIKVDASTYRHYSGATLTKKVQLWVAKTVDGQTISSQATAAEAILKLKRADPLFWIFGQYGPQFGTREYGKVKHRTRPVCRGDSEEVFTFSLAKGEEFPQFLAAILKRKFFDNSTCLRCLSPMSAITMQVHHQVDGRREDDNAYLSCICGYPVWRVDMISYRNARIQLDQAAANWRRLQRLKTAGGKHTQAEIRQILALQGYRCIYCNVQFTEKLHPSCDHILPITCGGGDWALNIVMACRSCNSSRGNIPFRTFCKLLSPAQNKKMRSHLINRVLALDFENLPREAYTCFVTGLALHDPKHWRYLDMQKFCSSTRRNAKANRLLPRSVLSLLKEESKRSR